MIDLVVDRRLPVAAGVTQFVFRSSLDEPLPTWSPGAHIDLMLENGAVRQYSLCGDPEVSAQWRIAVLAQPDGRGGSQWLQDTLQVGNRIQAAGPRNNFELVEAEHYVLIGGGIGITPLLPMMRALERAHRDWRAVYSGRSKRSMAFLDEVARYGEKVMLWPQDLRGFIDMDAALATHSANTAVYCCGPDGLIQYVEERCLAHQTRLHVERFRPRKDDAEQAVDSFEVLAALSGVTVSVQPGQTIADQLENAGVMVPLSCKEGICGSCETNVIDGIPDHRDSVLSDSERDSGQTMMICCSKSRTPQLALEI